MEFADERSNGDNGVSLYSEEDSIISGNWICRDSYCFGHSSYKKKVKETVMGASFSSFSLFT